MITQEIGTQMDRGDTSKRELRMLKFLEGLNANNKI